MMRFRNRRLIGALVVVNPKDGSDGLRGVIKRIDRQFVTLIETRIQNGSHLVESTCQRTLVPIANIAWIGVEADGAL